MMNEYSINLINRSINIEYLQFKFFWKSIIIVIIVIILSTTIFKVNKIIRDIRDSMINLDLDSNHSTISVAPNSLQTLFVPQSGRLNWEDDNETRIEINQVSSTTDIVHETNQEAMENMKEKDNPPSYDELLLPSYEEAKNVPPMKDG